MSPLRRIEPIKVMISSKCDQPFPWGSDLPLSVTRLNLKEEIESIQPFGQQMFEVWINEAEGPMPADDNSLEVCLKAVEDADILIVLYTGDAGWAEAPDNLGICHRELLHGMDTSPAKVSLIHLAGDWTEDDREQQYRNERFEEYVRRKNLFRGTKVHTVEELYTTVWHVLGKSIRKLVRLGVREASRGDRHIGPALDWSRLGYTRRTRLMFEALEQSLSGQPDVKWYDDRQWLEIGSDQVLLLPHSIPDAVSVADAREIVGRPFLHDWELAPLLSGSRTGPFHIISCHKNATELQAKSILGFPDAMVVRGPFGVFVADEVQKIQFCFITDCIDENSTSIGVQALFEWLWDSGEYLELRDRASARARIVNAIAAEVRT